MWKIDKGEKTATKYYEKKKGEESGCNMKALKESGGSGRR